MKKLTQEDVVNRLRAERLARARHRKERSEQSWDAMQSCIQKTNEALEHYDIVMYGSCGRVLPTGAAIRRMAGMNAYARKEFILFKPLSC